MSRLGVVELVAVGTFLLLALVAIRSQWRHRWLPERWAREAGLELTPRSEGLIRSYVNRTRAFRIAGGLIGFASPLIYAGYTHEPMPGPFGNTFLLALVGYLVGALLAELTFKRPRPERASATLAPRELQHYLPPRLSQTLRFGAVLALALVGVYLLVPVRQPRVDVPRLAAWALLPVVVAAGVEMLQRYIVRRPQPLAETDLVAADDAIRSASVHALAGAGIGLLLVLLGDILHSIGFSTDVQVLRWTLPWMALICLGAAVGALTGLTKPYGWQVRRNDLQAQP